MSDLIGSVRVSKRIRNHAVWLREPPSYGQAWIDLLLLTNDAPRFVTLNGERFELKRGQLCWSQRGLEQQWKRSREWIQRFIQFLCDENAISVEVTGRKTIVTVLNYDAYQSSEQTSLQTNEPSGEQTADQSRNGELVIGKGNAEPPLPEIPDDAAIREFCAGFKDLASGVEGIPEVWWTGWVSMRVSSAHPFPRDWKRAMALAHRSDWLNVNSPGHKKAHGAGFEIGDLKFQKNGAARERGEILQEMEIARACKDERALEQLKKELGAVR